MTAPRVLFVDHTAVLGGAELQLLEIVGHFRDRCHVALFADGPFRGRLEALGISVGVLAAGAGMLRVALGSQLAAGDVAYMHGMLAFAYEECHLIGEAEAALRSARAFFFESAADVYARVAAGEALDAHARTLLRLSSSHAAKVGADVATTAFRLSGTTGIFSDHSIARRMQDALVVPQHAFLSEGTWQSAGRVFLGLEAPPGFP